MLNKVALDRTGALYWNGKPVTKEVLDQYLAQSEGLNPEPWVFLETEMGAPCASLDAVRDQIDKHMHCTSASRRCNEGIETIWDNIPGKAGVVS